MTSSATGLQSGEWSVMGFEMVSDLFVNLAIEDFRKAGQDGYDLYFSTTLPLTGLESSLVFMVPLAWWYPLLSGVADSGAFQNRCLYTAIM